MDMTLRADFLQLWKEHFPGAELPIAFYYGDDCGDLETLVRPEEWRCLIAQLNDVRRGETLAFDTDSFVCAGGKKYSGFTQDLRPNFEYFLSCGIPGQMEGERYKKSPQIVRDLMGHWPTFVAPARYLIFKRWDCLEEHDHPDVVVFYARPDVLAGLFTLANFDRSEPEGVFAPFAAGCATLVQYPYLEGRKEQPRGVMGLMDPSARPWVKSDLLTFAVPMAKFEGMVRDMDQSFLTTRTWARIRSRMTE